MTTFDVCGWPYLAFPDPLPDDDRLNRRLQLAEQQLAQAFDDHDWDDALRIAALLFPDVPRQDITDLFELGRNEADAEIVNDRQAADYYGDTYVHRLRGLVEKVQAAETERGKARHLHSVADVPVCETDTAGVSG